MTSRVMIPSIVFISMVVAIADAQEARRRPGDPPPSEDHALFVIEPSWSLRPTSLKEMCDLSSVIVEGVVKTTFPSREFGRPQTLVTDALVDVTNVLKGSSAIRQVLIAQAGGVKGSISRTPAQYSLVQPGEKYILFLREDNIPNVPNPAQVNTRYSVTGIWTGLFLFENDRMEVRPQPADALRAEYVGLTPQQIETELVIQGCL